MTTLKTVCPDSSTVLYLLGLYNAGLDTADHQTDGARVTGKVRPTTRS